MYGVPRVHSPTRSSVLGRLARSGSQVSLPRVSALPMLGAHADDHDNTAIVGRQVPTPPLQVRFPPLCAYGVNHREGGGVRQDDAWSAWHLAEFILPVNNMRYQHPYNNHQCVLYGQCVITVGDVAPPRYRTFCMGSV